MVDDDLSRMAEPWLRSLKDDPLRQLPDDLETTTFPLGGLDLDGEVIEIDPETEGPFSPDRPLADEDIESGRDAQRATGIDVLAFYKSFRFRDLSPCRGKWGVFLLDAGIGAVESEFLALAPDAVLREIRKLAIDTLVAHERYHFWIDVWSLGQEMLPAFNRIKRYEYYLASRRGVCLTPYDYEESLANHYAYTSLRSRKLSHGAKSGPLIKTLFSGGPQPYSDFSFSPQVRMQKEGQLAAAVVNGTDPNSALLLMPHGSAYHLGASMRPVHALHPAVGNRRCPVHIIITKRYSARVQPFQGPRLKEFRQFVERYLAGEKVAGSDHEYYRIDNGEKVKFPNPHDKEVRGYELKGTLLKAGMTLSDFNHERQATKNWARNCPRNEAKPPLSS